MKDAKGHPTTDEHKIRCQVLGDGAFVSMDNGDLADLTPLTSAEKRTYRGQMVVYVRRTGKGKIHISIVDVPIEILTGGFNLTDALAKSRTDLPT